VGGAHGGGVRDLAEYPELIQRVLLVQPADSGGLRMSAYNTGTQRFDPIDWPADLASLRPQLALPFRRYEAFGVRTFTGVAVAEQPLVVHPLSVSPLSGLPASFDNADAWLLLALDQQLLLNTILPEAIRENLDQADSFEYQIARDGFPRQVIYRSNPDARMDTPDESVSLLELRREYLRSETGANRRSARFPIGDTSAEVVVQARLHRWHNVKTVLPGVPAAPLNEGGVWRLDIRHRAGSLEAAVARMRRGNLLLSFAMLALVAVAIAILALAARRAHRLSEAKLAFAAAVSHELRTPLAAICSAADNLSAGIATEPAKARQYGAAILEQGRYLSGLVEQILGFAGAHFGSRQFEMEMLDPADVIAEAIDAAVPSARTAGI